MIFHRSHLVACAALAAALVAAPALATTCANGAKDYPKCTPPASTPSGSSATSNASATAQSTAAAQATGVGNGYGGNSSAGGGSASSTGTATGGIGGGAQQSLDNNSPSSSSLVDSSSVSSRSWSLFLPPPVFTPPMAKLDCPMAHITQRADAQLWSGFSQARAETDPTDCTLIQLRNAKVETCQYATAKQIEDLMLAKHLKDFKANADVKFTDYSEQECAVLKTPAPPTIEKRAEILIEPRPLPPPAEVKVVPPCGKGQKRNSKGTCYTPKPPCELGQVLQCITPRI